MLLLAGLPFAGPLAARTVEFLDDLAAIRTAAADQAIPGPFSQAPTAGARRIVLETPAAADHRVIVASTYCQAFHIDNPVSTLLQTLVTRANGAAPVPTASASRKDIAIRVISGSTVLRCMAHGDLQNICKNRVRITAQASFSQADGSVANVPVVAQVEREGRVGGFCGNIARYTGIVTREAGIELIREAREVAGE